jgi:hypothetical protein
MNANFDACLRDIHFQTLDSPHLEKNLEIVEMGMLMAMQYWARKSYGRDLSSPPRGWFPKPCLK